MLQQEIGRYEPTHAVPEQDEGTIRMFLSGDRQHLRKRFGVFLETPYMSALAAGPAVPRVVERVSSDAGIGKEVAELVVTAAVLRESVRKQEYGSRLPG
jgi:hypothetical protein